MNSDDDGDENDDERKEVIESRQAGYSQDIVCPLVECRHNDPRLAHEVEIAGGCDHHFPGTGQLFGSIGIHGDNFTTAGTITDQVLSKEAGFFLVLVNFREGLDFQLDDHDGNSLSNGSD